MKGIVKFFDARKGFGFITADDGAGDFFVHFSEIEPEQRHNWRSLTDGEAVEFDPATDGERGPRAVHVQRLAKVATSDEG